MALASALRSASALGYRELLAAGARSAGGSGATGAAAWALGAVEPWSRQSGAARGGAAGPSPRRHSAAAAATVEEEDTVNADYSPRPELPLIGDPTTGVTDDTNSPMLEMLAGLHTYPLMTTVVHDPNDPRSGSEDVKVLADAIDDTNGIQLWQYDAWAGTFPTNYRNALLSERAKDLMVDLHELAPEKWTSKALAKKFEIREQRVLAIIALTRAERARDAAVADALRKLSGMGIGELGDWVMDVNAATPKLSDAQKAVMGGDAKSNEQWAQEIKNPVQMFMKKVEDLEGLSKEQLDAWKVFVNAEACERVHSIVKGDIWRAVYHKGTGERHIVSVPTFPKFEDVPLQDLPSYKESDIANINRRRCAREDAEMLADFQGSLEYNLLATGGGVQRSSRINNPPGKPEEGWSLRVTPLDGGEPFVAKPDGSRRALTADETLYSQRTKPKRRRRVGFR